MRAFTLAKMISGAVGLSLGAVAFVHAQVVESDLSALTATSSGLVGIASPSGDLVRSTDGGLTFAVTRSATPTKLVNLSASGDTVVAVGDAGFVVRSTDGGATWTNPSSPSFTGSLYDVAANGTFWVAVGSANGNVTAQWSNNAGESWSSGPVPTQSGTLKGVTYDGSTGRWTAVGTDGIFGGRILTSTDGQTWTGVPAPSGTPGLTDVAADGAGNLLAVGEAGTLLVSSDGGAVFTLEANSGLVSENLNVVVYSATAGWIAGGVDLAQVSYTTGSGAVLTQSPVPGAGDITALAVDATGQVITAGELAGFQSITFSPIADQSLSVGSLTLTATASSGLAVTFELISGPATLNANELTFTGTGTITLRAVQAGDATYGPAAPVERSFSVVLEAATVSLGSLSATYDGTPKAAIATTDPVGLTVVLTYNGSTTAPTDAGTYVVVGTVEDDTYSGSATDSLVIAKADQTISFADPADRDLAAGGFVLSASASSGLPVTFNVDSGPAIIDGATVTPNNVGTVTVTASQSGNGNYNAAVGVTQSFVVTVAAPEITLGNLEQAFDGSPKAVTATTLPPDLTVTVTYNGSPTPPSAVGSYTVYAEINDPTYAGNTTGTLVITRGSQTIDFTPPANIAFTFTPLTFATASSGLPVSFEVVSGPATLVDGAVVLTGSGDVSVRAVQAGDETYASAPPVERTFSVSPNFNSWRAERFTSGELADPGVSGPTAVYADDGINNLLKYALGLPLATNAVLPTTIESETGLFVFSFSHPAAVTDVTFDVEVSPDLQQWSTSGVTLENTGTLEGRVHWRATAPSEGVRRVFFRLKAGIE